VAGARQVTKSKKRTVWAPLHTTVMPFILGGVGLLGMDSEMPIGPRRELWERLGDSLTPQHLPRCLMMTEILSRPVVGVVSGDLRFG